MKRLLRAGLCLLFGVAATAADVRYVWKDNPNTPVPPYTGGWLEAATNIQDAVDAAADGDTVLVTNGVYDVGGGVAPGDSVLNTRVIVNKAVTVTSVNGPEVTLIVGAAASGSSYNGLGDAAVRGVYLQPNSALSGFTVTNGYTRYGLSGYTASYVGGGIRCESADALVTNCVIVGNHANSRGGGVYSGTLADCQVLTNGTHYYGTSSGGGGLYGAVAFRCRIANNYASYSTTHDGGGAWGGALTDCTVVSNTASRNGGGAFSAGITNCTVEANRAGTSGGGAYTPGAVTNSVFRNNAASAAGGGVYQGFLVDCQIVSNRVTGLGSDGGGFYGNGTAHRLVGCLVLGNEAPDLGGGVYNATLSNCVVQANRALGSSATTGMGGGLYISATGYLIYRTRFLDNEANYRGGGAYYGRFYNCSFNGNLAKEGGGAYLSSSYHLSSCTVMGNTAINQYGGTYQGIVSNCIIYANTAPSSPNYSSGTFVGTCADPQPLGIGNTNLNPLVTGYRDPHLLPGSPCIGLGFYGGWMAEATDFDGDARHVGGVTDTGADQFAASALTGPLSVTVVGDDTVVAGFPLALRAEAEGAAGALIWDFGDGAGGMTNENPVTHVYAAPGDYQVRVTVTNASGSAEGLLLVHAIEPPTTYVSPGGSHEPPFETWKTAATNLQDGIDAALEGGIVLVTNGVYAAGGRAASGLSVVNRACVNRVLHLCSVNGPEATAIVGKAHPSTGVGTTAERGVYLAAGASLCGFTVSNGFTRSGTSTTEDYYGGGVLCAAADNLVSNCVIRDNVAAVRGGGVYQGQVYDSLILTNGVLGGTASAGGGGLHSATARGCLIEDNFVSGTSCDGGGAYGGALENCDLLDNTAKRNGGGAYLAALTSCTVKDNSAGTSGGGAYMPIAVSNCILRGNTAVTAGGGVYQGIVQDSQIISNRVTGSSGDGGGYYGSVTGSRLRGCTIEGNEAGRNGGGVYNAVLSNCLVRANSAYGNGTSYGGGGAYANAASYSADQCRFLDNQALRGGGAYQGLFFSCVFSGNTAGQGGGVYLNSTTYQLNSCSVTGNRATNQYGGTYSGTIKNSIVYGNDAPSSPNWNIGTITYTCAEPLPPGTGNTDAEPQLTGYGDPRLLAGSPLIGAGLVEAWMTDATDIDGEARVVGGLTDIGADQYDAAGLAGPLTVEIFTATNVCAVGWPHRFRAEAGGRVGGILWDFDDGSGTEGINPASHAFVTGGVYTVRVTVTNGTAVAVATYVVSVVDDVRYVSLTGGHVAPFDTWERAATNLQDAVDAVTLAGGRVVVTNGAYEVGGRVAAGQTVTNRLVLDQAVRVESVNGPEKTSIVGRWNSESVPLGALSVRCAYVGPEAVLNGFAVSNGASAYATTASGRGGGLFLAQGGVATNCVIDGCRAWSGGGASGEPGAGGVLRGCVLQRNLGVNAGSSNHGGGAADVTLLGCQVLSNTAYIGGGVYMCSLEGCTLTANASMSQGGGAYDSTLADCELRGNVATNNAGGGSYYGTLTRCRLYDNTSTGQSYGGGAYDATLYSCVLAGNTASRGGGAYGSSSSKGLFNCTVVGNTATIGSPNPGGGGVFCGNANYPIRNSIIYYNTAIVSNNVSQGAVTYSCVTPAQTGEGNIAAPPRVASFERPVLLPGSPCAGAGLVEGWMAGALDFEGDPRTTGATVDIGADETQAEAADDPLSVTIRSPGGPYFPDTAYTFAAVLEGHPTVMQWDFGDGQGETDTPGVTHQWPEGGYTLRLTVSNATHSAQASLLLDVEPDTRYVSLSGSHTPPFRSWKTAATNLQDAADVVFTGGRIKVAAGVYDRGGRVVGTETIVNRLLVTNAVTVIAVDGPEATFIVGAASGSPVTNGLGDGAVRGVRLAAGAALQGFTVTGGRTRWSATATAADYIGGGVYCYDGTGVIRDCIVSNNAASSEGGGIHYGIVLDSTVEDNSTCATAVNSAKGGGIYMPALVSNCVVRANVAVGPGGGAYVDDWVVDSLFDGNESTGSSGGGCFMYSVGKQMRRCVVANNRSAGVGGGVVGASMTDCVLTNNVSDSDGGGYYCASDVDLLRCRIEGNRATGDGGGAYHGRLYACRVIGNTAGARGGGVYQGTVFSCAVSENQAGTSGGGCYYSTIENSTVVGNTAIYGGGCYAGTAYFSVMYYNTAGFGPEYRNTTSYGCCTTPYELYSTYGPVTAPPQISGRRDPHLLAGSPCIDSGDYRTWFQGANGFDLDGEARYGVPLYDIGADERYAGSLTGALSVAVSADQTLIGPSYVPEFWAECEGRVGDLVWDFGDGEGAVNVNPVRHTFPGVGVYAVRVTASNQTDNAFAEVWVTVVEGAVYVAPDGSHEPPFASWETAATNIQDAVDEALWGGTVWITNGVYTTGGRADTSGQVASRVCVEKALVVRSVNGAAGTTIQGAWHDAVTPCGNNAVRGAYLAHPQAALIGLTLAGGATDTEFTGDGGGVYCASAEARVSGCVITNCVADDEGGGIFGGALADCQVLGNTAGWGGGGVSQASLSNCVVAGNAAPYGYGGGVYGSTLTDCSLTDNTAEWGDGGGAYDATLEGCSLTGNRAYFGGGAEAATLTACELAGNTAAYGGGVYYSVCDGCSFIGNTAETDGGGSYDTWASFCTYTANVATNDGGGACYGYLENCLIQGNVAVAGDGGGFATTVSTDWLSACTVINNTAGQNGGGCYRGDLYDCLLTNNAAQNGGAYYVPLLDANGELCRCRVWDNRATLDGGGAYGGTLYSCVLAGNSAGQNGGGLYVGSLESCTVCGNTAGEQAGGCQGGTAYNSIIYYNQAPQEVNAVDTVFTKCCTPGGFVSAQPRVAGFYWPHLLPQSPCADVGVTRAWMQEDGAGDMERDGRVLGAETDIGADEAVAAVPSGELTVRAFSETLSIAADYVQTFRAEVAGIPASLVWDFGDGSCATNRNPVDHAFASTGLYTVRVTATNSDHSVYAEIQVTVVAGAMYVATDGSHEAPFATWETAATNIQDAVDLAPFGGTVWVGDGAYGVGGRPASGRALTNRVCVSSPVAVRSLNGPSAVTINGAWQSVEAPCGPAAVRGVYLGHPEARLFGVTVSGGASSNGGGETDGGGVYSRYAASVVSNCVVSGCVAESDGGGGWGGTWLDCWLGGNLADDGGGTFGSLLTRCTVSGNQAFWYGGGAFGGRATDCEITQNEIVFGDGGGGGLAYCDALRCTVRENSSESVAGGALGGVLVNCLIYGNQAASAGGVSAADVYNCTVTENEAVTEVGGADSCNVVNSIVWGNVAPTASNAYYCTFQRSLTDPPPTEEYDLGGNLNEDPQFVNPSVDNFRLRGTSPCVDAGTNMPAVVGSTDVEGEARFYNEVIDMGAYEYAPVEGYAAMGTPVSWLEIYFAGPDWDAIELDDPDGDGFLTWQEYIAMTNPMDQGSFFAVKDVAYGEDGADVSFDTALGRVYTVQHSPGLSPVSWSNASAPVTGTGGRMTVPVPDTDAAYFYRVRVSLP